MFLACQKTNQETSEDFIDPRVRLALQLGSLEHPTHIYHFLDKGTVLVNQQHRVLLSDLEEGYHDFEVYNLFQNPQTQTDEYYVSEFLLNPNDTINDQEIVDYVVEVVGEDSAWVKEEDVAHLLLKGKFRMEVGGTEYEIFQLIGRERHGEEEGHEDVGHEEEEKEITDYIRYWCPAFGTILIDYGKGRFFELAYLRDKRQMDVVEEIKKRLKELETLTKL